MAYSRGVLMGNWHEDKLGNENAQSHTLKKKDSDVYKTTTQLNYKWPSTAERTQPTKTVAEYSDPGEFFGHASYTGRNVDFEKHEKTTCSSYFFQDPRKVVPHTLTPSNFTKNQEPMMSDFANKQHLAERKREKAYKDIHDDRFQTSYQTQFSDNNLPLPK
eukprot:Platyproteum_vivax@DN2688_c0_g1_i2.p2